MGIWAGALAFLIVGVVFSAQPPCLDPISTVDWKFFAQSVKIKGVCTCATSGIPKVGIKVELAEPIAFVETTRKAWSFPCFGITKSPTSLSPKDGSRIKKNVHYIKYPVFAVLNIVLESLCVDKGSFDILPSGLSELNPLLWDDRLSMIAQPYKLFFASGLAQTSCLADCTASTLGKPMNELFWCAGCWGTIFPISTTTTGVSRVSESALIAVRVLDFFHESAQLLLTYPAGGLDVIGSITGRSDAVSPSWDLSCNPAYFPFVVKSQYFLQLAYPSPRSPVPIGTYPTRFFYVFPVGGDDLVWVVWRKRVCCLSLSP